ncbi:LptF/LptG family permease [Pleomorphomonas sp. NRK KF1]|uniref:LptF/LptG family permease n=1 Tax=Pleomorphomonas sp. NRK KF1 TaxID=2943000 RepID=UPI0020448DF3|nr:LptF/LptG family permease [Pleomorphomonas sp. NRK KF1]MCM5551630.1 LptF/LptG family permease [Pleomorphomonas sp. NRK KF1]
MRRFGTYLFSQTLYAFVGVMMTLAGIAWVTQALRRFDLVTAKGQAIAVYLGLTMLSMPRVLGVVAPFALVVALVLVLQRLQADSGIVAITAAGVSQRRFALPFLAAALTVAAFVAALAFWISPTSSRSVYDMMQTVRADIVANVIQPGRFTQVDAGLTFHIRNRDGDGSLLDLFILDDRSPEFSYTYSAKRGRVAEVMGRSMIVMEQGTVERKAKSSGANTFVTFGSYAFDLSQFASKAGDASYGLSERTLGELLEMRKTDDDPEIIPEIMNRIAEPIYPLAQALAVFLFLGFPTSNRRGQTLPVTMAIIVGSVVRVLGFAVMGISKGSPEISFMAVVAPTLLAFVFAVMIAVGVHPVVSTSFADRLIERLRRAIFARQEAAR